MLTKSRILDIMTRSVWKSQQLYIGYWNFFCKSVSTPFGADWDPAKTTITRATLVITGVNVDHDPIYVNIRVNGTLVKTFNWYEGQKNTEQSALVDVLSPLRAGTNNFEAITCKSYGYPAKVQGYIDAYLELEYTGEDPKAGKGWWQTFKEWFDKNWWMTIPAVVLAIIAAPAALPRRER